MPKKKTQQGSPTLPFSSLHDRALKELLAKYSIGLTVEEARKISQILKRDPTLVEATIWGIQGSEHSSYKSSKRFLKLLPTEGKHVILGPREDSGIVAITDGPKQKRWGIVISHESHNHPSQVVPFEGAATGVGGTVRDVLCMGARVIGTADALRLGDLQIEESRVIAKEVIRGIGGYGNPLGIPNIAGDAVFDASFNGNCLVNAIALGLVREDLVIHSFVPEEAGRVVYDIILVGKPTDRSGFGGAAFASLTLKEEKRKQNIGAVQEPNPFLERHLLASTYALFDWLAATKNIGRVSFKDLGAGGVVCATVEQVAERNFGARIELANVHTAIKNLPPEIIACAETQERMCWMCHPSLTPHILHHYNTTWDLPSIAKNACASVIGKVTRDGIYHLTFKGETVCKAKARNITSGLSYNRPTRPPKQHWKEPTIKCNGAKISLPKSYKLKAKSYTIADVFLAMISHPNYASRAPIFLHYDKTVMGNTIIERGRAKAGILAPLQDLQSYLLYKEQPHWTLREKDRWIGVAVATAGNNRYGRIAPYLQGINAVTEACCAVASVGALPRALTDCLNYGNPEVPEHLFALEEGVRGIADAARGIAIGGSPIPVISGNVSLYNIKPDGNPIDPSAIVCCIGMIPDARLTCSPTLKRPDSLLFLVGERRDECGGSAYYAMLEECCHAQRDAFLSSCVPTPSLREVCQEILFTTNAITEGVVLSCHPIDKGGLLLSLFGMTLPEEPVQAPYGVSIDLSSLPSNLRSDTLLFTETSGFILEVAPENVHALEEIAQTARITLFPIGKVTKEPLLSCKRAETSLFSLPLNNIASKWQKGLKNSLEI